MHSRIKYQQRTIEKPEPVAEGKVVAMDPIRTPTAMLTMDDPPTSDGRKPRKRGIGGKPTSAA
jgi:hypothetical protein